VTIITHSVTTAAALAGHPRADVIVLGGRLHKRSVSASGAATAEAAWSISADLALLALPGIHPEHGITTDDPDLAAINRLLISRAADTYVIASAEQLGTVRACKVTGISDIAGILADAPASHPTISQLRHQGATIIPAS
jgi:DeoR/GlpR family transcriptional regulator of sugar metabolism